MYIRGKLFRFKYVKLAYVRINWNLDGATVKREGNKEDSMSCLHE